MASAAVLHRIDSDPFARDLPDDDATSLRTIDAIRTPYNLAESIRSSSSTVRLANGHAGPSQSGLSTANTSRSSLPLLNRQRPSAIATGIKTLAQADAAHDDGRYYDALKLYSEAQTLFLSPSDPAPAHARACAAGLSQTHGALAFDWLHFKESQQHLLLAERLRNEAADLFAAAGDGRGETIQRAWAASTRARQAEGNKDYAEQAEEHRKASELFERAGEALQAKREAIFARFAEKRMKTPKWVRKVGR